MEKAHLIESFSNNGSTFEIYSVDDIFVPGGTVIDFYVIQKKQNSSEENYFIDLYGDSSYTYDFCRCTQNLNSIYEEIKKQPKPKTMMMKIPSYKLPLGEDIDFGEGRVDKQRIIELLKKL
jgi:hypothetical protein